MTSGGTVGGATTVSPATQMQLHAMLQKSSQQQQQQQGGTVATVTLAPSGSTGGVTTATLVPTRIMTLQQQPGAPTQTVALKQGLQVSPSPGLGGTVETCPRTTERLSNWAVYCIQKN